MKKITVGTVKISEEAKRLVNRIMDSNRVSGGKYVAEFENKFAKYHKVKHAIAVNTGTAADAIALALLHDFGAKRGDGIIIPALTFVATANAVLHAGFNPIFIDIKRETYNIDPVQIERFIEKECGIDNKTNQPINQQTGKPIKAIMPVHLFGRPADMDPILEIARKYRLYVIEDAAQAHGAEYKGKKAGAMGDLGAFSFYVAHIITTGEGGAIITNHDEYAGILRSLRAHGRACKCKVCVLNVSSAYCPLRFKYGPDARFYFERIGYSAKMNELEAALGIREVERLDEIVDKRRENMLYLNKGLSEFKNYFQLFEERKEEKISPLAYPILIKEGAPFKRRDIVDYLEHHSIETRPMFSSLPTQQPAYKFMGHKLGDFPNAEYIGENGFYIGIHQNLNEEDLNYIIEKFKEFIKGLR